MLNLKKGKLLIAFLMVVFIGLFASAALAGDLPARDLFPAVIAEDIEVPQVGSDLAAPDLAPSVPAEETGVPQAGGDLAAPEVAGTNAMVSPAASYGGMFYLYVLNNSPFTQYVEVNGPTGYKKVLIPAHMNYPFFYYIYTSGYYSLSARAEDGSTAYNFAYITPNSTVQLTVGAPPARLDIYSFNHGEPETCTLNVYSADNLFNYTTQIDVGRYFATFREVLVPAGKFVTAKLTGNTTGRTSSDTNYITTGGWTFYAELNLLGYPELSNNYVTPTQGNTSTPFEFGVDYKNGEGLAPTQGQIYIDGVAHDMTLATPPDNINYYAGVKYVYNTSLGMGLHNYYFVFSDGSTVKRYPVTGTFSGPEVLNSDTTPPVTTSELSGTQGANGWYVSPVTAALSATDDSSGVNKTEYSLDGGVTWKTYNGSFSITDQGNITLNYRSVDNAGNVEETKYVQLKIDTAAPAVSIGVPAVTNKDVQPVISVTDNLDLVPTITITLDGAPYGGTAVTAEGLHTIMVTATDEAGNSTTQSASFLIDKTAPAISLSGVTDGLVVLKTALTPVYAVSDNFDTAPLASATLNGVPFASGTTVTAVGVYDLVITAQDAAGNISIKKATFTIADQSMYLEQLTTMLTDLRSLVAANLGASDAANANGFLAKLDGALNTGQQAMAAITAGDTAGANSLLNTMESKLNAFTNQVNAQSGKKIDPADALSWNAQIQQIIAGFREISRSW